MSLGVLVLVTSMVLKAQVLPKPDSPFQGKIDINPKQSTPDWPTFVTAPEKLSQHRTYLA